MAVFALVTRARQRRFEDGARRVVSCVRRASSENSVQRSAPSSALQSTHLGLRCRRNVVYHAVVLEVERHGQESEAVRAGDGVALRKRVVESMAQEEVARRAVPERR